MKIIFNGQICSHEDPLFKGLDWEPEKSVFETFVLLNGRTPGTLNQHWSRLFNSAQVLGVKLPSCFSQTLLDKALITLVSTADLSKAYRCKVLVSTDFWWIKLWDQNPPDLSIYTKGVLVDEAPEERIFAEAKWSSPVYKKYAKHQKQTGVFETLFLDKQNNVLEGSITNVIAVINQKLISPGDGVLPGITVRSVLARAEKIGFKTEFRDLPRAELLTASEIFITNAVKGVVPVRAWGDWRSKEFLVYEKIKKMGMCFWV